MTTIKRSSEEVLEFIEDYFWYYLEGENQEDPKVSVQDVRDEVVDLIAELRAFLTPDEKEKE